MKKSVFDNKKEFFIILCPFFLPLLMMIVVEILTGWVGEKILVTENVSAVSETSLELENAAFAPGKKNVETAATAAALVKKNVKNAVSAAVLEKDVALKMADYCRWVAEKVNVVSTMAILENAVSSEVAKIAVMIAYCCCVWTLNGYPVMRMAVRCHHHS